MNDQTPSRPDDTDQTDHIDPAEQTLPIAGMTSLAPPPPVPADAAQQTAVTNPVTGAVPGDGRASGLSVGGRVWSLRTVVAAAITAVALSGAGGAALAAAADGGSDDGPGGRGGFGQHGRGPGQGNGFGQPGQGPGQPGRQGQGAPGGAPQTGTVPGQLPSATTNDGSDT